MNQYKDEAKNKWGDTKAYQECEDKTAGYTKEQWAEIQGKMDAIMNTFAQYSRDGLSPDSLPVQTAVARWQQFLTQYYYDCTKEILGALGRMYDADPRFRENIDRYGTGTASLLSKAICKYCE